MALPDLRIVIVSWNVEPHLRRCLASLPDACKGLAWDVVVVDNASEDKSVDAAREHGASVIANERNRGFAKACNQGIAGSTARYVLLLNPDTECPPGSLAQLVAQADLNPTAGIIGPKLLNADGTTQPSIRRFPSFWSQIGVMLKLHRVMPWAFRRYLAANASPDQAQEVDQVMGACFLIRGELIQQIGGLDERYFIWFEEVDYCKQALKKGWSVRYEPSVAVTHHGGQSFGQLVTVQKQQLFNASLVAFFEKWHPGIQPELLKAAQPIALALAWLAGKMPYSGWAAGILALEIISRLTIFHDAANSVALIPIAIAVALMTYKRPTFGLAILAVELLIGSQGRLLQLWGWPGAVSLRMALFIAFLLGWSARAFWKVRLFAILKERWEWVLLAAAICYGVAWGWTNPALVADVNAWAYGLLLIPVIHLARTQRERLVSDILPVLFVAPIWLAIKAVGLEYLFAHGLAVVEPPSPLYLWIRRTGTGEITPLTTEIHRIFMQSQVFALAALLLCTSYYFTTHEKGFQKYQRATGWVLLAAIITLLVGYSRSFWIGAVAGLALLIALHLRGIVQIVWAALRGTILAIIAAVILTIAIAFPYPSTPQIQDTNALAERISTSDAASSSRWELIAAMGDAIEAHPIVGYGLGATLTYQSSDPRVLAQNPDGQYTTFAFEWGWLDHWFKLGVFGLIAMAILIVRIAIRVFQTNASRWMRYGVFASLIALAVTHFFTPYLNHPLGIGYLLMIEGWVELQPKE